MSKFVVLVFFSLTSCCGLHNEIEYKYGNTVITRIDECGKTVFFYGGGSGKIWVEYSGINDGFTGYLNFKEDGSVILLSGDGYFRSEGLDTALFTFRRILSYEAPKIEGSVCAVSLSTKSEIERNQETGTTVQIKYNMDENDWW